MLVAVFAAIASGAQENSAAADESAARAERTRAARETIRRIEILLEQRPNDAMLQYYLAMFHARAGDRAEALSWLRRVAERRLGFHPTADGGFDALQQDAEYQQIVADIEAREPRVLGATEAFRLPDARFIPEGIAYDPRGRRFFIGSIAERRILERTRRGRFVEFSTEADGLKSVLGLRVDSRRGLLYAVSTNAFAHDPDEARTNALFVYDLATRKLRDRYVAVEAISFNDVAVSADGQVAVTDSGAGAVYRLDPVLNELILLVAPGRLSSANGIDFAPDGKRVFVAVATGIASVDLKSGAFERLAQADDVVAGAIDGLYVQGGDLIGVQNAICPGRVLRLHLDPAGQRIERMTVLQAYHPLLDEPTTGAIVGRDLFVIANSSVARLQADRSLRDENTLRAAAVIKIGLDRR